MTRSYPFVGKFLFLLPLILALPSCLEKHETKSGHEAVRKSLGKVVVHQRADPFTLHPAQGADEMRALTLQCTQRFVLRTNLATGKPLPDLVCGLPRKVLNGLGQEYILKNGIRWHDGSALAVQDVIFTVKAGLCPGVDNPHTKQNFKAIEGILSDSTNRFVVLYEKEVFANHFTLKDVPVLQASYYDSLGILNRYSVKEIRAMLEGSDIPGDIQKWITKFCSARYGHDPKYHNGLGPYRLANWEDDSYWTLVKKKNDLPNKDQEGCLDTIIFRVIQDEQALLAAFREQSIDISNMLSDRQMQYLRRDSLFNEHYWYDMKATSNYTYAAMNMHPRASGRTMLFDDEQVRRAMSLLSPVDDILKIVYNGNRKRSIGPVCSGIWYGDTGITPIPFAPDSAKALLNLSGWADSDRDGVLDHLADGKKQDFSFTLTYLNVQEEWADIARLLKDRFQSVGMQVQLEALDPAAWYHKATTHDFDMLLGAWNTDPVIDDPGQLWLQSSWYQNGHNFPGFGDGYSDSLIDALNHAPDQAAYQKTSHLLQRKIVAACPMIFLAQGVRIIAVQKRLGHPPVFELMPGIYLPSLCDDANKRVP